MSAVEKILVAREREIAAIPYMSPLYTMGSDAPLLRPATCTDVYVEMMPRTRCSIQLVESKSMEHTILTKRTAEKEAANATDPSEFTIKCSCTPPDDAITNADLQIVKRYRQP